MACQGDGLDGGGATRGPRLRLTPAPALPPARARAVRASAVMAAEARRERSARVSVFTPIQTARAVQDLHFPFL